MLDTYHDFSNKTKVIKMYSWLAYDVFLVGLLGYNWVVLQIQSFATILDGVEKFILFLCTATFAGYRIYILHRDGERKTLENRKLKQELEPKVKRG